MKPTTSRGAVDGGSTRGLLSDRPREGGGTDRLSGCPNDGRDPEIPSRRRAAAVSRRTVFWIAGLAGVAGLVYLMATADTGPVDPTESHQSHGTAVFNSSIIVFREGLEAVLIFAAVTASFIGGNRARRRPVVLGAACAFGAASSHGSSPRPSSTPRARWTRARGHHRLPRDRRPARGPELVRAQGLLERVDRAAPPPAPQAAGEDRRGRHGRPRRSRLHERLPRGLRGGAVPADAPAPGRHDTVLEGVGIGLAATALVGVAVFHLHRRLPYRKMLVLTGVLVGAVLVVMIGGTALTFSELGWIRRIRCRSASRSGSGPGSRSTPTTRPSPPSCSPPRSSSARTTWPST